MGAVLNRVTRSETHAGHTTLEIEVCGGCGVLFAAPKHLLDACREDGDNFYCPNGHSLTYGEGENDRLKRQLKSAKDRAASERAYRDQAEASLRATKGVVTKQRKKLEKVVVGVCPVDGCKRYFRDLHRHLKTKHPDYEGQPQG